MPKQEKTYTTPILTLENKKEKNIPSDSNIYACFGNIEGILHGYEWGAVSAERTLDDMRDVIDFYNNEREKLLNGK